MLLMRGATGAFAIHSDEVVHISIHAPYARSDLISMSVPPSTSFQSTLLMRGATGCCCESRIRVWISIHAPHARSDGCSGHPHHTLQSISIHAPHARSDPAFLYSRRIRFRFQSTLLMRGATWGTKGPCDTQGFQSTLLMRGATDVDFLQGCFLVISIHAPHARSDQSL